MLPTHVLQPGDLPRGRRRLAVAVPLLVALAACGGDGGGSGGQGATTTTVTVTPASTALTTARPLNVTVTVTGSAQGVVTLTSGAFSTGAQTLAGGAASFTIPAGVLPSGPDTLTARYTSSAGAAGAANGTATVTVSDGTAPTVTAQSADLVVSGHAFQAIPVGSNVLVSVTNNGAAGSQATGVNVYAASSPSQLSFVCTQAITPPSAFGLAMTPNGMNLAVAVEAAGVNVLSLPATTAACNSGETTIPQATNATDPGTFDLAITADGNYAFVANEDGVVAKDSTGANIPGNVAVVALNYDGSGELTSGTVLGQFSTGGGYIAGVTLSPDGKRLYVTSEIAQPGPTVSAMANTTLTHSGCTQAAGVPPSVNGILSVVDVAKAEATPTSAAIIATVASGCSPVRIVETNDNQVIWVAARGDDNVLAFSTHMLESDPDNALIGYGNTGGVAPVGLQLFHNQQLLAVANSNRFATPDVGNMTIMNAVPVNPTVLTKVTTTNFPRNLSKASDDATLYLTDYDGGKVQIISTQAK